MAKQYKVIGLGGTFDRFHIGHEHFLQFAAHLAEELWIGITTESLHHHKTLAEFIEPYEVREERLKKYLTDNRITYRIFPLNDVFGPTVDNPEVEAVAVTEATQIGAQKINEKREKLGRGALPVHVCSLLKDSFDKDISSTRIRLGEINRRGENYQQLFTTDLKLSEKAHQFFMKKQGEIVRHPASQIARIYVVGDMVLDTFLQNNWSFNLGIFDTKNQREVYESSFSQLHSIEEVANSAGYISQTLVQQLIPNLNQSKKLLKVNGEEDLAAVALVLLAQLNSLIYYGQPDEGMVEMKVTEELKEKFFTVLKN